MATIHKQICSKISLFSDDQSDVQEHSSNVNVSVSETFHHNVPKNNPLTNNAF